MINAPSDTVRGLRVGPMRPGTGFDGDDWAAALDAFRSDCPRDRGMRRAIVPGTVRVFGIAGYGAVQLGRHRFIQSKGAHVTEAMFIQLWQWTPNGWRATKTISIDHRQQARASR
jgi:hypothetical protein